MDGKHRETLGERLANRLSSRSRRRPRMAMDAAFYGRFGLSDPWSDPETQGETETTDGMVFLSGAPFHAMMRRLANARRRRSRREDRFFSRRAGTTMRAATRRRAGEAEGVVASRSTRMGIQSGADFVLPPPISAPVVASEVAAEGIVSAPRPAYQAMRPVASPWYSTPFVPARVIRGGASPAPSSISPRPLARIGERLQAAVAESAEPVRVAAQLPLRTRRAISAVFVDELPADMPVVEIVRVLRRMGAPSAVIREVVELAPAAAAASTAARRMPTGATAKPTGLRTVLARSPAMALAATPEADKAAAGTLAGAERSAVHTGADRPRAALRTSARIAGRSAVPDVGSALSASPVARASAGRPAALRAAPVRIATEAGGAGPAPRALRSYGVTARVGGRFVAPTVVQSDAERPAPASANAMSRAVAAPARSVRPIARFDGASWAFVRAASPDVASPSILPDAVPGRPRAVVPRKGSAVRPVEGSVARFVPARIAAATGSLTVSGRPPSEPQASVGRASRPARSLSRAGRGGALARPDVAGTELLLPVAGASPVQQAFARLTAGQDVAAGSAAASIVPHPTPRLDRPVRASIALSSGAFTPVQRSSDGSPESVSVASSASARAVAGPAAVTAIGTRPGAPARRSRVGAPDASTPTLLSDIAERSSRRSESPTRTASRRASALRVATTEVVRAESRLPAEAAATSAAGPMAWAPSTRFAVPRATASAVPMVAAARPRPTLRGPVRARGAQGATVEHSDLVGASPVREPSGRYVSVRSAVRKAAESAVPARFGAMSAGRVDVVYVTPSGALGAGELAEAVPVGSPVRSMAWAASRSHIERATAYRGAIADGGSPVAQQQVLAEQPGMRLVKGSGVAGRNASDSATAAGSAAQRGTAAGARRALRAGASADAPRPATRTLARDAFVAAPSFGFEAEPEAPAARAAGPAEAVPARVASARRPLDRRLHDLTSGGAATAEAPVWNARAEGAPRVRSVHGLFESLARATTAEQVVHVLFARADGLLAAPAAVAAPIQQVIQEIRQEVARPIAMAASDEAALPTRATRLAAPVTEQLRPSGSRPSTGARVARGTTRPVASRTRTVGSGSEDRIMKLVKKLQGLIHLAEAENRLSEAQRQVRMAEDSEEARAEGGQGSRAGGPGASKDGSKMDIEQLGREVLEVVTRELEFRRERRMEDHDESVWW